MSKINAAVEALKSNRSAILIKGAQGLLMIGAYAVTSSIIAKRRPTVSNFYYGDVENTTEVTVESSDEV